MRSYSIKRGHKPDLNALIKKYFGAEGDVENGMEFVAEGIGKIHIKKEKNSILIETEPMPGDAGGVETIKKWNDFLFEATGRTAKERKKLMEKEMTGK